MSEYEDNQLNHIADANEPQPPTPEEVLAKAWADLEKLDRRFYWTDKPKDADIIFVNSIIEAVRGRQSKLDDAKDAVSNWIQSVDPDTLEGHAETMLEALEDSLGIETEIEVDFEVEAKISITTKRKVWEPNGKFIEDLIEALDIRVHNDVDYSVDRVDEV